MKYPIKLECTAFLMVLFVGLSVLTSNSQTEYKNLKEFDALISNWNSFPDNDLVWPGNIQKDLLRFLNEGGGLVFFHSSTSCLYKWPEFKKISTGIELLFTETLKNLF